MCRPREVDSQDDDEIYVKILKLINYFHENIWLFQINKKIGTHVGNMSLHTLDRNLEVFH